MPGPDVSVEGNRIVDWISRQDEPAVFAGEVADWAGHSRQWARDRLRTLVINGEVRVKTGGREKIYWVDED